MLSVLRVLTEHPHTHGDAAGWAIYCNISWHPITHAVFKSCTFSSSGILISPCLVFIVGKQMLVVVFNYPEAKILWLLRLRKGYLESADAGCFVSPDGDLCKFVNERSELSKEATWGPACVSVCLGVVRFVRVSLKHNLNVFLHKKEYTCNWSCCCTKQLTRLKLKCDDQVIRTDLRSAVRVNIVIWIYSLAS